ncbi:MAG: endonuclease/exonuclease/phosphatase family protein [Calditrichaeota bacterium]|nr:MAG: endonuclease/exonuclease/phosphatase family protein [Calditrichota bacterium]
MPTHYLAWWNVENLFDVVDSPTRPAWLQRALNRELTGWNEAVLSRKISQLARIIRQMNEGRGPDVLGLCEVENRAVLDRLLQALQLPGRNYAAAHHDGSDQRGIDVAFIYDADRFTFEQDFFHVVLKRAATRDIYQVNLRTADGHALILIGNHWPARTTGVLRTEPYRIIAAETLSYWNERIFEIRGRDIAIVVMGDFNDEPFSRSITEYLLATSSERKVINSRIPRLFNLMWPLLGQEIGTHYYDNFPLLIDQIMVSRGVLTGRSGFRLERRPEGGYAVAVEMFPEMVSTGYPDPIRFGRPAERLNENGFSDHYPVSLRLVEG